jgi:hypothetical protein
LTKCADGESVVIGDARNIHYRARVLARRVASRAGVQTIHKRNAFGVARANGKVVGAKATYSCRALNAGIAAVCPVATVRAAFRHRVDTAARRAFLTPEAIRQVQVVVDAIGRQLAAHGGTHGVIGWAGIDAIDEIDAIDVKGTRL